MSRIRTWLADLLQRERCAKRLALSISLGVFVAFSPLIGLHTIMIFLFARLFRLNVALLFAISTVIHNPWTMIPIYASEHVVGSWLFRWVGVDAHTLDPSWLSWASDFVAHHVGIKGLSLGAFLLGGNLLAVLLSVILYPLVRYMCARSLHGDATPSV
jgi:uncharacterized protein (DUF2062 family)